MDNNHPTTTRPDPTPQPVPAQWTLTYLNGRSIHDRIEASLAAEHLGIHVHDPEDLPLRLDEHTWLLDTPYVVVAKLASEGQVEIANNGYSAEAEWPDHVPVPDPTYLPNGCCEGRLHDVGCWWCVSHSDGRDQATGDPEVDDPDEIDDEARCPACGEPISYCQGHGEIGDPSGFAVLQCHDRGDHASCHPDGCEFLDLLQATIEDDGVQGVAALLATPPQVWIVESVVHEGHPTDASGESCTDECFRELALSTWYPTEERAAAVADELYRQTLTDHQPGLLVLDPENPTLPM